MARGLGSPSSLPQSPFCRRAPGCRLKSVGMEGLALGVRHVGDACGSGGPGAPPFSGCGPSRAGAGKASPSPLSECGRAGGGGSAAGRDWSSLRRWAFSCSRARRRERRAECACSACGGAMRAG